MPRIDGLVGRIDRSRTLEFTFDGQRYTGHPGDTLASALLANGVSVVGHSPYLGRPRGVFSAGSEEPNAIVAIDHGTHMEPMARATGVELFDGLIAHSLRGKGRVDQRADTSRYDKADRHCDVLVIGGGAAGLAAAQQAAATGARVILVEDEPELGGRLLHADAEVDGLAADAWLAEAVRRLASAPEVQILTRSTALGVFDEGYVVVAERRTEHLGAAVPAGRSRQRLWHIRARRIVLATGAIERPIAFADNDRPGVMLAGAVLAYARRFGVAVGRRVVLFTNNDTAYGVAAGLLRLGIRVAALIDVRDSAPAGADDLTDQGVELHLGSAVVSARGEDGVTAARVARVGGDGPGTEIACDVLGVSGGWTPTLHLYAQAGGELRYDAGIAAHVPDGPAPSVQVVGAASGTFDRSEPNGHRSGTGVVPFWAVPPEAGGDWERHFVDLQRDATVAHLHRAVGAGLRSLEHIKRYTTIGTGFDQGKTSNLPAIGITAELLGVPIESLRPTTYRPPFTPVPFAVLAGRRRGQLHDPVRRTAMHPWHVANGAVFEDVGQWKRPRFYPAAMEDMDAAVRRECAAARSGVAVMDASTLGKIDVQGPDAGELLDRVYTNMMSTVPVGMCRYGVICSVDGMIFDDGVVMRVADDRFVTTTTTGNAAAVLDWLEEWLQTEWPELRVHLTSVTDHWSTTAVVGPRSRDVIGRLVDDVALDAGSFPFMAIRETRIGGAPVRLCRVSFSGELAFEIHTPARFGLEVWEAVMRAGAPDGITPYGTEAMHVLRAEKGYVIVGQETDGTVTPQDAAMSWAVSKKKEFFVGRRSHRRPAMVAGGRRQLVGLLPEDPELHLPEGAQILLAVDQDGRPGTDGHVTSSYVSGALGRTFAMALVAGGLERLGGTVVVRWGRQTARATVTGTVFYDPEGSRRDGEAT